MEHRSQRDVTIPEETHTSIPVPDVAAYNLDFDGRVGGPRMIMDLVNLFDDRTQQFSYVDG
ncbi:uncharacterized protein BT62DRAFT_935127 [Guyanagaster necrorhizus]|uniref:Uncharacterized protein n=1 Tax=Guyanagaster necrorhizus TaxID=856835 RepID=A0A9P7VP87_9AGAR|nr:uncharacterized protein BT62DRAFT_935127 [Guyanagaster necrorhizus MCA 3950]KAG7443516.1 hypothetical protein BT62DRAFT_935127 [Guyanagaster necrorhizus MCA 3950]